MKRNCHWHLSTHPKLAQQNILMHTATKNIFKKHTIISNEEQMGLDFRDQEMVLKMSVLLNKCVPFQPAQSHPGFAQEWSRAHGAAPAAARRIVTSVRQKCLLCSLRALAALFCLCRRARGLSQLLDMQYEVAMVLNVTTKKKRPYLPRPLRACSCPREVNGTFAIAPGKSRAGP